MARVIPDGARPARDRERKEHGTVCAERGGENSRCIEPAAVRARRIAAGAYRGEPVVDVPREAGVVRCAEHRRFDVEVNGDAGFETRCACERDRLLAMRGAVSSRHVVDARVRKRQVERHQSPADVLQIMPVVGPGRARLSRVVGQVETHEPQVGPAPEPDQLSIPRADIQAGEDRYDRWRRRPRGLRSLLKRPSGFVLAGRAPGYRTADEVGEKEVSVAALAQRDRPEYRVELAAAASPRSSHEKSRNGR